MSNEPSNEPQTPDLETRISELEAQIAQLSVLTSLPEKANKLQEQVEYLLNVVTDVERYGKLGECLSAGQWKDADEITTALMLEAMGQSRHDKLTPDNVLMCPCSIIRVIDRLWLKYSDGKFGFSVQKKFYVEEGGSDDISKVDMKILEKTAAKMGWFKDGKFLELENLDFSLDAPAGSHPSGWWRSPYGGKMATYFFARMIRCGM
ncbi:MULTISPECIES: GUN4 domain-containing protein [unclassified Roseofilum]|uniref:GUN4 domain-containing protein n=1 Tax=unclassified Roseofilum TaxID=2620099 RepID=UPI001B1B6893|nr:MULTISPECIES: GUN4 domain-containing protein [unclassified Roseofilum]MBP0008380.1 GUN4 domain-containing protein [Roseofilum sp. Belize Diploria]MBP0014116.1 GUN4 domain-containing protein [Roseofilum sp. SID3]MBP0024214.1 GUN4 domain-containing protein [Roseofilum sp. SID2]MBP0035434.1 GUN4 domain-containing protein [Roseofilum sp. Belize BBD 4]MBP0042401.1 GUN4 domain-containing protein [Roseofilum sp. SBFL]